MHNFRLGFVPGTKSLACAGCLCAFTLLGETLTWCGPDGGAWSESDNWTNSKGVAAVPADGDCLVIPARDAAITLENNIENLTLKRIAFTGSGAAVTLKGKAYTLDNPSFWGQSTSDLTQWPFVVESCVVTNEPVITIKNSASGNRHFGIYAAKKLTFTSDVTGNDIPGKIYTDGVDSSSSLTFLGRLTATNATLWGRSNHVLNFYSPIRVKGLWCPGAVPWASWSVYFRAAGNVFENIALGASGSFYLQSQTDCVPPNTVFKWDYAQSGRGSTYYLNPGSTGNVVIDHVEATDPNGLYVSGVFKDSAYLVYGYSGMLTMRGTQDVLCYARFSANLNVVWDPVGDYTLELRDRTHDLKSGYGFKVNRGRLVLSGETKINGTYLELGKDAIVDVASSAGIAMPNVTSLTMDYGSRLYITNAATQAFAANALDLTIKDGAYIEVGSEAVAPTFKKVTMAYGAPVAAGNYTGVDGVAGAAKVPWLRGAAVVTVSESSVPASGDNYWKSAVNGDWSDASKWTLGVPDGLQKVHIEAQGEDYVVTVTGAVRFANQLTVAGTPSHKTTFLTKGQFTSTQRVYLEEGGVLDTLTNGVFQSASYYDPSFSIAPGAELRVSGGLCNFTNDTVRYASIAGMSAKTATVTVASGCLRLYSNSKQLKLGDYAHLNVTGGELLLDDGNGNLEVDEHLKTTPESRVTVSGAGRVRLTGVMTGQVYGSGKTELAGNASYWSVNRNPPPYPGYASAAVMGVRAGVGETAEWTIREHAVLEYGYNGRFYVGNTSKEYADSRSVVRFLSDADHGVTTNGGEKMTFEPAGFPRVANYLQVGCGSGYGEFELADGFTPFGEYGVRIGSCENSGKAPQPTETAGCTGLVQVTGGRFSCRGASWREEVLVPPALLIGWGWPTLATEGHPYNGIVRVSGGSVSNQCHLVLGMYRGSGEWSQSGGETVQCNMDTGLMVGVAGGTGRLTLSGGTFRTQNTVYVGGAPVSAFCNAQLMQDNGYPSDRHDATGVLSVSGGAFTAYGAASSTVYVGKDGDGTVEMDGAGGSFTANTLELAAGTVEGVATKARIRFKLNEAGNVSPIAVNNVLKISPDSELVIDATQCPEGLSGFVNLLVAGSVDGDFDPANVSIVGDPKVVSKMSVKWRGTKLALRRGDRGSVLIVR